MDTNSLIVHVKKEYIYKDIAKDVEKRLDSSNYKLERSLPKQNKKKSHWFNER